MSRLLSRPFVFLFIIPAILTLNVDELFEKYVSKYNRTYIKGSLEYNKRLKYFKDSLKRISISNKLRRHNNETAWFGINQFSDLHPEEFKTNYLQTDKKRRELFYSTSKKGFDARSLLLTLNNNTTVSTYFDWRDKNAVTKIKDQQNCGACWAFSMVETVESMRAIKHKNLYELSVQEVVDCSPGGEKCNGGDICSTAKWLVNEKINLLNESEYPWKDKPETCSLKPGTNGTTVRDYTCLNLVEDEISILNLIENHGPVTAAVDATLWQDYMGGVIQHHCYDIVNHAIEIGGRVRRQFTYVDSISKDGAYIFTFLGPIPYYIVRNSWGSSFGNNGYVYVKFGSNVCGIAQQIVVMNVN